MASLDFDQKFLGRIAKRTEDSNPYLSNALYQILGLSVLLSRRLIRARKLRKLDTSRDTPSLAAYQHILWISREGLSILELYVLPYAQDDQHGAECRVLSVKLRASFYHIFCLFHNQPPVTTTNMDSTDPRGPGLPPPTYSQGGNSNARKAELLGLAPPTKRNGKQPALREPIDSIVSETSFVTNPYPAGGPVGTPSPGPPILAPPGLNPVPIPQPSSFLLPPLNFVPLASGYFATATSYATSYLPGSHPLRLSVALEHSAFLWDCLHDHEGSRRVARRAIKDVYRAQEAMDDTEFEDAAQLVGILGKMMKRKSWEGTPRVGGTTPEPAKQEGAQPRFDQGDANNQVPSIPQHTSQNTRRAAEGPPLVDSAAHSPPKNSGRSHADSTSQPASRHKQSNSPEHTPRSDTQRRSGSSQEATPRRKHASVDSGASNTPRMPQGNGGRSPATPSSARSRHNHAGSGGSQKGTLNLGSSRPVSPSAAAMLATENMRASPTLRRSPPLRSSPVYENTYPREQR